MVFNLDMDPDRATSLGVPYVDVSGTLEEELMKRAFQQPHRQMAGRVACLKIETFSCRYTAHGLRRKQGTGGLLGTVSAGLKGIGHVS
jgi:hypothetical protein